MTVRGKAGWQPARRLQTGAGRVTNPPQVGNLPYKAQEHSV